MILTVTLNPSVDRTLFVARLSPHETNRVTKTETDAGGKGVNAARVLKELGQEVCAAGFLGGGTGAFVRSVLDREGVSHSFVEVGGDTRLNVLIEEESGGPPTTLNERGPEIRNEEWEALRASVVAVSKEARAVVFGGSVPPGLPPSAIAELVRAVRRDSLIVAVDCEGDALRLAIDERPDIVKPNGSEASALLGLSVSTPSEAAEAARRLLDMGVGSPIVSIGALGAVVATKDGAWLAKPPRIEARSTIGSGDSLLAGYVCGVLDGLSPAESLRLGTAAGAATAMTSGAEIGRRDTIRSLVGRVTIENV